MKQGKKRTLSIDVTAIPKERLVKHENGKVYLNIETWDYDEPKFGNDFSVSMSRTKDEIERIKAGETIERIYLGNGRIWEPNERPLTEEEQDDLPF
ncbi:hypothetical protein JJL45_05335 [Tamlana sp. s12]|uniref:hypothetical protein n=1 Tax=Tamlana sp. s12 TaxID=1630406 RepID=UPI0008000406|nr:hypothetical protein [Tamlana sp. s12]OBQ56072.1 hypothetical protein VQ01_06725 [Tamlana sp. s12]QQY83415.1 hypothetical protein JJL45_05335 [Tamlana sp. s12]